MVRSGLRHSGRSIYIRHVVLPCERKYSGKVITVNKLVEMHKKTCALCKDAHVGLHANIDVDQTIELRDRKKEIEKVLNHARLI